MYLTVISLALHLMSNILVILYFLKYKNGISQMCPYTEKYTVRERINFVQ